jgi:branched-chain amino acid transport system permease protein/neutral amino acid transport system permease protein
VNLYVLSFGFGLITASILAIASVGFTLQFGVTNILNLAYGDVMTGCAFIAYLVTRAGGSLPEALLAGAGTGALASYGLNRFVYTPFVRRGTRMFGMIIVTISMSLALQNGLQAIFKATFFSLALPRPSSYTFAGMIFTSQQLVIIALAVVAMLFVHAVLSWTKLGRAMRATAADPELARSCGIATDRVIDAAWLLSGALCGTAGVALALNVTSFTSTAGGQFLIPIIAAAVLGGVGHPYGAMVGAVVIGLSAELSAAVISPSYKEVVAFLILIVVLLIRPQGIFSEVATQKEVVA